MFSSFALMVASFSFERSEELNGGASKKEVVPSKEVAWLLMLTCGWSVIPWQEDPYLEVHQRRFGG